MKKIKEKLVIDWKESWKFWSTQLALVAAVLQAIGMYFQEFQATAGLATFILVLLVPVVRVLDQKTKRIPNV